MKIFTIVTQPEGCFNLLQQTSQQWGYELQVLGWNQPWKGLAWKLELYVEALRQEPPDQPVVCVDGYDVVVVGPATELLQQFNELGHPVVFSGQRYFPKQKFMRILADQLMSNSFNKVIGRETGHADDYSRPCMGLLIGYAGALADIFEKLVFIERMQSVGNDQILLNLFHLNYPGSIALDFECRLFQNLWRTRGGRYGKTALEDPSCEVEIHQAAHSPVKRIRNKQFGTFPFFLHAPFNLDMGLILHALDLDAPPVDAKKSRHYWQYTMLFFIRRGMRFYAWWIIGVVMGLGLVTYGLCKLI